MLTDAAIPEVLEATAPTMDDLYLTADELAARHRVDVNTLANLRARGDGLPYTKISGRVLYKVSDVLAAEARGTRGFSMARLAEAASAAGLSPAQHEALLLHLKRVMKAHG